MASTVTSAKFALAKFAGTKFALILTSLGLLTPDVHADTMNVQRTIFEDLAVERSMATTMNLTTLLVEDLQR